MVNLRIIPRLDIKGKNLIKTIHLEGLRIMGDPHQFAKSYYESGADELLYMDAVASLYGRNNLADIISHTASDIFIPLTVGGGIRSVEDAKKMLHAGADKVAINTAAIENPDLISQMANNFGNQCVVISIEAKKQENDTWEAYTDGGREHSGKSVKDWIMEAQEKGAGEILLTSIDQEGTEKGFDLELISEISAIAKIPLIISGGMGKLDDMLDVAKTKIDAISMASLLHYKKLTLPEIKKYALDNNLSVRSL